MRYKNYVLPGLAGWTILFLIVGLWPFRFGWPSCWELDFWPSPKDGLLNFLSFLPFGILLSWAPFVRSPLVTAGIYCLSISVSVEFAQLFMRGRTTSVSDVALNTLGGVVGAAGLLMLSRRQRSSQGPMA